VCVGIRASDVNIGTIDTKNKGDIVHLIVLVFDEFLEAVHHGRPPHIRIYGAIFSGRIAEIEADGDSHGAIVTLSDT
jgi:hypothetical protein